MEHNIKRAALGMGIVAVCGTVLFFAWLFSLQGSRGLGEWGYRTLYLGIAALGLLPLILGLVGGLVARPPKGPSLGLGLSWAGLGLGILVVAGLSLLFGTIYVRAHHVELPLPTVRLLSPNDGLAPDQDGGREPVLRLALSSDPHWGAPLANAEARTSILRSVAAEAPRPAAFFILGDNTQMGWNDGEWRAEALDLEANLGGLPVRPLLGNHDAIIDGQFHFLRYFFPRGMGSDSGSPYYYSIEAGPALVVVLDLLWGAEEFGAAQRAWLERTLSAAPRDKRIIVLSHCFFASSGYVEGDQLWYDHPGTLGTVAPILERHKVDLVVQGHNHYMEVLRKDEVTYATIGAMGGFPDPKPSHVSPWSLWFQRETFGYLDLEASASGITLRFKDQAGALVHEERVAPRQR